MAMPIDALVGLELNTVLKIEAKAAAAIAAGGTVVSWSGTGISVSRLADGTPSEILRACHYAKQTLAPHIYGQRITRTSVSFARVGYQDADANSR